MCAAVARGRQADRRAQGFPRSWRRATFRAERPRPSTRSPRMLHALRHFAAEFIGTFVIVFFGSMALLMANGTGAPASVAMLVVALAVGLATAVMVTGTMRVAGHLNPAVTL